MFVFCFSLVLISGFVIHEFRVAGKKEKDGNGSRKTKGGDGDGDGGDSDDDVPLLQRNVDPTGLTDPLGLSSSSSTGIYEDNISSAQQQQQAILAQQQQLMHKLDTLVSLMQRDLASRGVA